jgi:hypothetical protein
MNRNISVTLQLFDWAIFQLSMFYRMCKYVKYVIYLKLECTPRQKDQKYCMLIVFVYCLLLRNFNESFKVNWRSMTDSYFLRLKCCFSDAWPWDLSCAIFPDRDLKLCNVASFWNLSCDFYLSIIGVLLATLILC